MSGRTKGKERRRERGGKHWPNSQGHTQRECEEGECVWLEREREETRERESFVCFLFSSFVLTFFSELCKSLSPCCLWMR